MYPKIETKMKQLIEKVIELGTGTKVQNHFSKPAFRKTSSHISRVGPQPFL